MTRSYDPSREVGDEALLTLLGAAATAPSAGLTQGWDVVVLRSGPAREGFWRSAGSAEPGEEDRWTAGMRTAPVLLVVVTDPGAYERRYAAPDKTRAAAEAAVERPAGAPGEAGGPPDGRSPWWDVDASMASLLVLLAATDAGLGACFFGVPPARHAAVLGSLGVPAGRRLLGVVSVGVPAPHPRGPAGPRSPHRPRRRTAVQVAHEGRWGAPFEAPAER